MNKLLLPCLLSLSAVAAQAQQGGAKPAATTPGGLLPRPSIGTETQILEYGSFELPRVKVRTPKETGGDPLIFSGDEWVKFQGVSTKANGSITVGVTNEVSHTGRQSIYVEFNKLTALSAEAQLSSQAIEVKPQSKYRVSIWGQMDKKQPISIMQRIPTLRLQLDYYEADGETQTDQEITVQPMPGSRQRPFFAANRWSEYYVTATPPENAHYLKITWSWVVTPEIGETNGVMFFDDATLIGERVETPEEPDPDAPAPAAGTEMSTKPGADAPAKEPTEATPPEPKATPRATPKPAEPARKKSKE